MSKQFNKESNGFILQFTVAMVLIVAVALAFASSQLKPLAKFNSETFEKTKILKSVIVMEDEKAAKEFFGNKEEMARIYKERITEFVVSADGSAAEGDAFTKRMKDETRKAPEDMELPLYVYEDGEEKIYIVPMIGLGLWDEISGYIALEGDMRTVRGAAFDHKGETPGLGAEIATSWFQNQFQGKELFNENGEYEFKVLKGVGNAIDGKPHVVDGLSGATMTADGVDAMLDKCINLYKPFFESQS